MAINGVRAQLTFFATEDRDLVLELASIEGRGELGRRLRGMVRATFAVERGMPPPSRRPAKSRQHESSALAVDRIRGQVTLFEDEDRELVLELSKIKSRSEFGRRLRTMVRAAFAAELSMPAAAPSDRPAQPQTRIEEPAAPEDVDVAFLDPAEFRFTKGGPVPPMPS